MGSYSKGGGVAYPRPSAVLLRAMGGQNEPRKA